MTKLKKVAGKSLAAIAVAGLAVTGAAGAASAAEGDLANIDPEMNGESSLTVHKLVGSQGAPGDGTVIENPGGTPLGGVEFTIWQLGLLNDDDECVAIDLGTYEGWESVPTGKAPAELVGIPATDGDPAVPGVTDTFCLVDPDGTSDTTGSDGSLTFGDLDFGLYYVQETDASGAYDADGPVVVVSESLPFYVAIPMPNATDGSWIYDVHAYPKNQTLGEPSKEINEDDEQEGLVVGSTVEWTITQNVPALNVGETYESASIYEALDPEWLEYVETSGLTLNGTALVEGTDYVVDGPTANAAGNMVVTWMLTGALEDLAAGDVLAVTFTTTVLQVSTNGEIENPGSDGVEPGYGSEFNGNKIPGGPTPATYWGALEVEKVDQEGAPLAGAVFEVYPLTGDACPAAAPAGAPVSTGTSDDTGLVLWTPNRPTDGTSPLGLFVHNTNDETEDPAEFSKTYCMYETVVPAGYTGIGVKTIIAKPGTVNTVEYTGGNAVVNVQKEGPTLPLTGANGTLLMSIGGVALVAIAGGLYLATRRKATQA